jgi:hypothetical protein
MKLATALGRDTRGLARSFFVSRRGSHLSVSETKVSETPGSVPCVGEQVSGESGYIGNDEMVDAGWSTPVGYRPTRRRERTLDGESPAPAGVVWPGSGWRGADQRFSSEPRRSGECHELSRLGPHGMTGS